jgi:hypothetical protein
MRVRRRWLIVLTLLPLLAIAVACSGSDEADPGTEGASIGDRYLRLFEVRDLGSSLFVYDGELPPDLASLLNPGLTDDTPEEDVVAIPVPDNGELLGSYHIRRRDGTNEIWLAYDVPGIDTDVESTMRQLLDETPWQVTGGQSNELFAAISFQSTVSGDIEGFVTLQALPSAPTYEVTVERDGAEQTLELPRGAFIPEIDARFRELSDGLEVTEVLSDDQLQEGDLLVAVGGMPVSSERELYEAFRALGQDGEPRTATLYRLTVQSPSPAEDPIFVTPRERPLPDDFPAEFLISDDLTVVEVSWNSDSTGDIYQVTMVTDRSAFDVAEDYRQALDDAGWELTGDEAQGFGTLLNFQDEPNGMVGVASIDQFESDDSLNAVVLQIQVGRGTS